MAMRATSTQPFFVVVVAGATGSGIFIYSPTAGAGNLVASIAAAAGTDPYGNAYLAGFASYGANPAAELSAASLRWVNQVAAFNANPLVTGTGGGGANQASSINLYSGKPVAGDPDAALTIRSHDTGVAQAILGAGTPPLTPTTNALLEIQGDVTTIDQAFGDSLNLNGATLTLALASRLAVIAAGITGYVPATQVDHTVIAVTAAVATRITKAWSIPGGNTAVDTVYRLTAWGFGTLGSTLQNLTWGIGLNGAVIRSVVVASPGLASQSFRWRMTIDFHVLTTGAGGTADCNLSGTWGSAQAATTEAAVTAGSTSPGAEAINTTVANDIELMVAWASTTGAPTITCIASSLERVGP